MNVVNLVYLPTLRLLSILEVKTPAMQQYREFDNKQERIVANLFI